MEISINSKSPVRLGVQIVNQIRFAIAAGRLRSGDQLVAAAPLAQQLRISRSVIHHVYQDLEVLGLVRLLAKRNVTIKGDAPGLASRSCREYITEGLFQPGRKERTRA